MEEESSFKRENINYEKIQKTIKENCYSLSGLARKIHKPIGRLKKAITREGKHNWINDFVVYVDMAIVFQMGIEELIY